MVSRWFILSTFQQKRFSTMKLQHQTTFGGANAPENEIGNCYATCIASILGLPVEFVPNFCAKEDWYSISQKWLGERGLMSICFTFDPFESEAYSHGISIASGPAIRGHEHAVLWKNGKLFHDPHPSGAGLIKATNWEIFSILDIELFKQFSLGNIK